MNPVLFQRNGVQPGGAYLPGQYRWSFPVRLNSAQIVCQPPSAGVLTLTLEIGGELSDTQLTIPAGNAAVNRSIDIEALVPANTFVRWKASHDGGVENASRNVALTLFGVPQSVSEAAASRSTLTVQWINGPERLTLFNYDAATHAFTETITGISDGRAAILQDATRLTIAIRASLVLAMAGGICFVPEFVALGGVATVHSPRLVFCVNNVPIATLTASELRVTDLVEDDPDVLTPSDEGFYDRFEFYSDGVLTAALTEAGLTAKALQEPVP